MVSKKFIHKATWVEKTILFGLGERKDFYQQFEQEMQAGNDLMSAQKNYLIILDKTKKPRLRRVFLRIFSSELRGLSFGDRFGDLLPFDERIILNAASQSGNELETFKLLKDRVVHKQKSGLLPLLALLYPLLTIGIALRGWNNYGENMARLQNSMLEGGEFTGLLGFFVDFHNNADWVLPAIGLGFVLVLFLFARSLPNWVGQYRTQADKVFPFSLYRRFQTANFLITYASLRKRGMDESSALRVISQYATPWLRIRLMKILTIMKGQGKDFGNASIIAGYNVPELKHALTLRSMNQNKDFGDRLLEFSLEAQNNVMGTIKATFASLFILLLVAGLGAQYAITIASTEIKSQVETVRNRF